MGSSTETVLMTKTAASTTGWKRATVTFEITGGNPNLLTVPVTLLFDIADAADSYGAYIDNVILTPVEVKQPAISDEGVAGNLASVNNVRLCRWLGAFYGKDYADSAKFPKDDQDRFVIHLPMQTKAGAGTVSVWLSTEDAAGAITDDPTEIELTETAANSGVFESPALVLVADKEDDELTRDENAKNDPTHFGKAGGEIVVKVPDLQNVEVKFGIEKATHKLKLDFVSVTPPIGSGPFEVKLWATGATSPETVSLTREQCLEAIEKQKKRCIEIYAQLGIEVEANCRGSLAAYSQGSDTAAWQRVDAAIRKGNVESGAALDAISPAERGFDLLGRIGDIQQLCHDLKKEDNIVVVLLPAAFADVPGTPSDERGAAGIYSSTSEGWCFVSIPWVTKVVTKSETAAHEVGHALGLQHESRKLYELMTDGGAGISSPTATPYSDQKRFVWPDIKKLLKERTSNPLAQKFLIPIAP